MDDQEISRAATRSAGVREEGRVRRAGNPDARRDAGPSHGRVVQVRAGVDQERADREGRRLSEYTGRPKSPAQPDRRRAETGVRADDDEYAPCSGVAVARD